MCHNTRKQCPWDQCELLYSVLQSYRNTARFKSILEKFLHFENYLVVNLSLRRVTGWLTLLLSLRRRKLGHNDATSTSVISCSSSVVLFAIFRIVIALRFCPERLDLLGSSIDKNISTKIKRLIIIIKLVKVYFDFNNLLYFQIIVFFNIIHFYFLYFSPLVGIILALKNLRFYKLDIPFRMSDS